MTLQEEKETEKMFDDAIKDLAVLKEKVEELKRLNRVYNNNINQLRKAGSLDPDPDWDEFLN